MVVPDPLWNSRMIRTSCPHCNTELEREVSEAGTTIDCPSCGDPVQVPPRKTTSAAQARPQGAPPAPGPKATMAAARPSSRTYPCPKCGALVNVGLGQPGDTTACTACGISHRIPPEPVPEAASPPVPSPGQKQSKSPLVAILSVVGVVGCLGLLSLTVIAGGIWWGINAYNSEKSKPRAKSEPPATAPSATPPTQPVGTKPETNPVHHWVKILGEDEGKRSEAVDALVALGKEAVPELTGALQSSRPSVRLGAATALGKIGLDSRDALPKLLVCLSDEDPAVARAAAEGLPRLGPPGKESVPILKAALKSKEPAVRLYAVNTFGALGADAQAKALADLIGCLNDTDEKVANASAADLKDYAPDADADGPVLVSVVKDGKGNARAFGVLKLSLIAAKVKGAVPALTGTLKDPSTETVNLALLGLGKLGEAAASSVPVLLEISNSEDKSVRVNVVAALVQVGKTPETANRIIALLEDDDADVSKAADQAVEKLGPFGAAEVPALLKVVKGTKNAARLRAMQVLALMAAEARDAVPVLTEAAAAKDLELRNQAVVTLGAIGPDASPAVKPLIDLLADKDEGTRQRAAVALGKIGPKALPAVPALAKLLKQEKNADLRNSAATALGGIGSDARDAVPDLLVALKTKETHDAAAAALVKIGRRAVPLLAIALEDEATKRDVRVDILTILGDIGPDARDAVPAIKAVLAKDEFPTTQRAGKAALEKIQKKP